MSDAHDETPCPWCGASNDAGATYCLECGERVRPRETAPAAGTPPRRGALLAALAALLLLGAVAAAYIADRGDEKAGTTPTAPSTSSISTGGGSSASTPTAPSTVGSDTDATGSGTDAGSGSTDTTTSDGSSTDTGASTETTTTTDTTDTSATTETTDTTSSSVPDWPGTSQWTVVLQSFSKSDKQRSDAEAFASGVTIGSAGVLDSDQYSSLRPGYWVVWLGEHATQAEAAAAAKDARATYADAYPRRVAA